MLLIALQRVVTSQIRTMAGRRWDVGGSTSQLISTSAASSNYDAHPKMDNVVVQPRRSYLWESLKLDQAHACLTTGTCTKWLSSRL